MDFLKLTSVLLLELTSRSMIGVSSNALTDMVAVEGAAHRGIQPTSSAEGSTGKDTLTPSLQEYFPGHNRPSEPHGKQFQYSEGAFRSEELSLAMVSWVH